MRGPAFKIRGDARTTGLPAHGTSAVVFQPRSISAAHDTTLDVLPRAISPKEFLHYQALIYKEAGIWLSEAKTALLTGRLSRRLRTLGLDNFSQYYERVITDDEERQTMVDAITTNETHFFREPAHFRFLEQQVMPFWQASAESGRRSRTIRVWSAGCATGQEAYSLAMMLVDRFPPEQGWSIEILATDISCRALAIAEKGMWDLAKAREIPPHYLRSYMLKGYGQNQGKIKAGPAIRVVRFMHLNLNEAQYPALGHFDLIFCRNVLIYFDLEGRKRVIGRLLKYLAPGAYLFVGHAESLNSIYPSLRCVIPTVYSLGEKPERS